MDPSDPTDPRVWADVLRLDAHFLQRTFQKTRAMRITSVGAALADAAGSASGSPLRAAIVSSIDAALEAAAKAPAKAKAPRRKPASDNAVEHAMKAVQRLSDAVWAGLVSQFGDTSRSLTQWRDEFISWIATHPEQAEAGWAKAWGWFCYERRLDQEKAAAPDAEVAPTPAPAPAPAHSPAKVLVVDFTGPTPVKVEVQQPAVTKPAWLLRRLAAQQSAATAAVNQ